MVNPANQDRRQKPRGKDGLYRFIVTINLTCWLLLVCALVVFHFARPDFVSGVQNYWGVAGRTTWSAQHVNALIWLLQISLGLTLFTMLMRARRTRRQEDHYGINLFILAGISVISLLTLNLNVT
ncbi:hypothetical protein [Alteromonas sp. C1M14]|uniref:hypothetical protein n=1 Tax=Alteromonas sp. C1M14 TaxID=2841567 RepID=UPI001C093D07|nr:hypothetical protein [Alteromonas sp. C1M14]MBU2977443.1 hypothetical protein [Alteromonas sp. C1M14]